MHRVSVAIAILAVLSAGCGCCVRHRPHSICRTWADWNTLGEPALFIERIDHLPYKSHRVGRYRWMYGLDPGLAADDAIIPTARTVNALPPGWTEGPTGPGFHVIPAPHGGEILLPMPPEAESPENIPVPLPNGTEYLPVPPPPAPAEPAVDRRGSTAQSPPGTASRTGGSWLWRSAGRNGLPASGNRY